MKLKEIKHRVDSVLLLQAAQKDAQRIHAIIHKLTPTGVYAAYQGK